MKGDEFKVDKASFGITITIIGMGGTLLSLWILSLLVTLFKKVFPYSEEKE
jgi:Na+-transporting methylmalonyl-CoA/oxaloacetate decarboxylase gamma subunit